MNNKGYKYHAKYGSLYMCKQAQKRFKKKGYYAQIKTKKLRSIPYFELWIKKK